jgi:hypothetical protein
MSKGGAASSRADRVRLLRERYEQRHLIGRDPHRAVGLAGPFVDHPNCATPGLCPRGVDMTCATGSAVTTLASGTSTTAQVPTLGRSAGIFASGGVGFDEVEPSEVFNGSDPTG